MPHPTTDCCICDKPDDGWGHPYHCEDCHKPICAFCWNNIVEDCLCLDCQKKRKESGED